MENRRYKKNAKILRYLNNMIISSFPTKVGEVIAVPLPLSYQYFGWKNLADWPRMLIIY